MSLTYQELVRQAKDYFIKKLDQLKYPPRQDEVNELYYFASIFGLQRVVDLLSYLRDSLDLSDVVLSDVLNQRLFSDIKSTLRKLIDVWIAPLPFGEFFKDGLTAMRPLYEKYVETSSLLRELSSVIKPNWGKRISYCLPVVLYAEYPYALRIPTRFLNQRKDQAQLHLFYIDWNHQPNHNWLSAVNLLRKWEQSGHLIYHGALEVPIDRILERQNLLPYYVVFRLKGRGEDFLRAEGVVAHVLKLMIPSETMRDTEFLDRAEDSSLLKKAIESKLKQGPIVQLERTDRENRKNAEEPRLSVIPFRVEDLSNPRYPWPSQPETPKVDSNA